MKLSIPYLILLAVSGAIAYWSTIQKANITGESENQVQVWDGGSKDLNSLNYKSLETVIEINRKTYEGKRFYWGKIKKQKETSEFEFLLSNRFEEYLSKFHPLTATRVFKNIDDAKLKEFGFEKLPRSILDLSYDNGETLNLEIGSKGFGGEFSYVREKNQRAVWLLPQDIYDDLESLDARFFEKNFMEAAVEDIKSFEFLVKNTSKKILHSGKDPDGTVGWQTVETAGNTANPGFKNWFDRFARLRVVAYPSFSEYDKIKASFIEKILVLLIDSGLEKNQKLEFFSSKENQDFVYVISNLKPVIYRVSKAKIQPLVDEYQKILAF